MASSYQISHLRLGWVSNSDLRGGKRASIELNVEIIETFTCFCYVTVFTITYWPYYIQVYLQNCVLN